IDNRDAPSDPAPCWLTSADSATCTDRRWEPGDLGSLPAERGGLARESAAVRRDRRAANAKLLITEYVCAPAFTKCARRTCCHRHYAGDRCQAVMMPGCRRSGG